ncbi:MAG: MraZ N-terminal domain containing protein [Candidatus Aenigmarchaeota archaeon]|nr:MraZ N-terminal domain containing protein [Candidatus Aenigmarchaeota archaeon]
MSSSCSKKIFAKIDERGRIYLPAKIRRFYKSVSFSADLTKRKIFVFSEGRYGIDSKGRVSIPADIRRSLGLSSGNVVALAIQ